MASTLFSLREIGRRLNIPPSSVVYYKDRFSAFIPHTGDGKRRRYPQEALAIFRDIREMFDTNHSAEEIEMELSNRYRKGFAPEAEPVSHGVASEAPSALASVLERMSTLLDDRRQLENDLDAVRRELSALRASTLEREKRFEDRIRALEDTVKTLTLELRDARDRIQSIPGQSGHLRIPPDSFLELPLVIRTDSNEYLGVAGKTKHFSLSEFIAVIRENSPQTKNVSLRWNKRDELWTLNITTQDTDTGKRRVHQMEARQTTTPSGNDVVCLTKLVVDGKRVPDSFLLVLFRKIKDGFDL